MHQEIESKSGGTTTIKTKSAETELELLTSQLFDALDKKPGLFARIFFATSCNSSFRELTWIGTYQRSHPDFETLCDQIKALIQIGKRLLESARTLSLVLSFLSGLCFRFVSD